ncbi:Rrf2 family transcriptional regulator [Pontiellaceae bacterium B12219]|nr:Rrf2 family transcriptional regulator [Pontiellaceae bacterium B12219]
MMVSKKGFYAGRVMLCIARRPSSELISKTEIAKEAEITSTYICRILSLLKNAGLVLGQRGIYGGYRLARLAGDITMYDIIIAAEGKLDVVGPLDHCSRCAQPCMRKLWCGASRILRDYYSSITLDQLLQEQSVLRDEEYPSFKTL